MPIFYMLMACVVGSLASMVWVLTGGTMPSAFGIYVLTGNLLMLGLIARVAMRSPAERAKA